MKQLNRRDLCLSLSAFGALQSTMSAQVGALTGDAALHEAEVLGPAPAADAQAQGVSYLAILRDAPPAPGTALRAMLAVPGEPVKVMVVPRSALVRHEGGVHNVGRDHGCSHEREELMAGRPSSRSALTAGEDVAEAGSLTDYIASELREAIFQHRFEPNEPLRQEKIAQELESMDT